MTKLLIPLENRKTWTIEELDQLTKLGAFGDRKFELLEGDLFEKMTQLTPHAVGVRLMTIKLESLFQEGFDVRGQLPLVTHGSKPEPDLAVVEGTPRDFLDAHPSTALLVVEISDMTFQTDRDVKSHIYARAHIPEYWIVNLNARQIEVRRDPRSDETAPLGWTYGSLSTLGANDELAPLAFPESKFLVADVLP